VHEISNVFMWTIVLTIASRIVAKGEQNASHYLSNHETSQGIILGLNYEPIHACTNVCVHFRCFEVIPCLSKMWC
jgi:hypothetical protein